MTDLNNNAFAVFDEEDNSQIINKSNLQDKVTEISKQQSDSSNVNNSDDASGHILDLDGWPLKKQGASARFTVPKCPVVHAFRVN